MDKFFSEIFKTLGGYITVALSYFIGLDNAALVLLILAAIDYITGVTAAIVKKEVCSKTCWVGILKKMIMFALVGVANIVGNELGIDLRIVAISFYIGCEGISIIENSAKIGLPIPKKLSDVLEQLKGKGDSEDDTDK